jgi:hypothetical protein
MTLGYHHRAVQPEMTGPRTHGRPQQVVEFRAQQPKAPLLTTTIVVVGEAGVIRAIGNGNNLIGKAPNAKTAAKEEERKCRSGMAKIPSFQYI